MKAIKPLKIGDLSIDMEGYAIAGNAILGIRDSGKSYSATSFAEALFERDVPFIAFDPTGIWRWLRVPGPGKDGRGIPVVVAGGRAGDLPLTVAGAPQIVRAAMQARVSLVIDLFDRRLSKADWRRIVTECMELLFYENSDHGLRHIFLEEAPEFAPQRVGPGHAHVYDMVERVARMGGNSGLGITLIGQRSAEISKAVLELCDNLYLHRQKGKNAIEGLDKWFTAGAVTDAKAVSSTLSTLPTGKCWAWLAHSEQPVRLKMPAKHSHHPNRRERLGQVKVKGGKPIDVGSFVEGMRADLVKLEEEAKANDPKALKAKIAELQKQLASKPGAPAKAAPDPEAIATELAKAKIAKPDLSTIAAAAPLPIYNARPVEPNHITPIAETRFPGGVRVGKGRTGDGKEINYRTTPSSGDLPQGEHKILLAIAQHTDADGVGRDQLTALTGYKRATRNTYIQRLGGRGLVEERNGGLYATEAGMAALGENYERLPTGEALQEWWLQRLPEGESKILKLLLDRGGQAVSRDEISDATGYKRATRNTYLQRLGSKRLVDVTGDGVKASRHLFD